jgi:predicted nucleic acid-binding protein
MRDGISAVREIIGGGCRREKPCHALALAERHHLSIGDAMVAASALHADCDTLWSEDVQHGRLIDDRLRIVNPFRATLTMGKKTKG